MAATRGGAIACLLAGLWAGGAGAADSTADWRTLLDDGVSARRYGSTQLSIDLLGKAVARAPDIERPWAQCELGASLLRARRLDESEAVLTAAYRSAGPARAGAAIDLGNLALARHDEEAARRWYLEAQTLASNPEERLVASLDLARTESGQARLDRLSSAFGEVEKAAAPDRQARFYLNLGAQAQDEGNTELAYRAFDKASSLAPSLDERLRLETIDAKAALYESEQRIGEALQLSEAALHAATGESTVRSQDLLFRLHWRKGRLLWRESDVEGALAEYREAAALLEAIRQDLPIEYENGRSSYQETLKPVFTGLGDLTLQSLGRGRARDDQPTLREAVHAIELARQSEMQDYLGDRCTVEAVTAQGDAQLPAGTAVVYQLLLPDRIELLVETPKGITRRTVAARAGLVSSTARLFAENLLRFGSTAYVAQARELYDWLVRPIEEDLEKQQVRTLVVVPDGALRLVPLAALNDGSRFVVDKFAVTTVTGMTMTSTAAPATGKARALLAGLSEPGPVVGKLPAAQFRGGDLNEALALPGVKRELEGIEGIVPGEAMLDQAFTLDRFTRAAGSGDYRILHIASHGVFGGSAADSYIMTYDELLTMNSLEALLRGREASAHPIDLLTLSACETAQGNDRAPLGISGVAIKARAKSVVGTLWPVSDDAAQQFMQVFYDRLVRGKLGKAEAMREAQQSLRKDPKFAHPFFWSPFVIIGNWS